MFAWGIGVLIILVIRLLVNATRDDATPGYRFTSLILNSAIVTWVVLTLFH